ncbi:MAG: hypothetical protein ABIQ36_04285 [Rhodanobacter sp.]
MRQISNVELNSISGGLKMEELCGGLAIIGGGMLAIALGPEVLVGAAAYYGMVGAGLIGAGGGGMIGDSFND